MIEKILRRLAEIERVLQRLMARANPRRVWLNVLDYIPSDEHAAIRARTSTYNTGPAWNAAIVDANAAGGGIVYGEKGTYPTDDQLEMLSYVTLLGDGPDITIIEGTVGMIGVVYSVAADAITNWGIRDLTVVGIHGGEDYTAAIDMSTASYGVIENVSTVGAAHAGVVIERESHHISIKNLTITDVTGTTAGVATGVGMWFFRGCYDIQIEQVTLENISGIGYCLDGGTEDLNSVPCERIHLTDLTGVNLGSTAAYAYAILLEGAADCSVNDFSIETVGATAEAENFAIALTRDQGGAEATRCRVTNGSISDCGSAAIAIQGASKNILANLTFTDIMQNTWTAGGVDGSANAAIVLSARVATAGTTETLPRPNGSGVYDNVLSNVRIQGTTVDTYEYGVKLNASAAGSLALIQRNRFINCDVGSPTTARIVNTTAGDEPLTGINANTLDLGGPYSGTGADLPDSTKRAQGYWFYLTDAERWVNYVGGGTWRAGAGETSADLAAALTLGYRLYIRSPLATDRTGAATDILALITETVTTGAGAFDQNLVAVQGDVQLTPESGVTISSAIAGRGLAALARNLGAGTITTLAGLWAQVFNTGGGVITNGYALLVKAASVSGGGSITTATGVRIENQGSASTTHAYGVYVEAQTGAGTTNDAIHVAGGRTYLGGGAELAAAQTTTVTDAGTTNQATVATFLHATSGTPGVGFGSTMALQAHSSTNTVRNQAALLPLWVTATDASRKARASLYVYDTAAREAIRMEGTGTAAAIGFLGAAAIARPTVTGSRGGNAALASLLTQLASLGLITDSSSA
jgi:hypothetical protein